MFLTDHVLTELWIMAMATLVNGSDAYRAVHADMAALIAHTWRAPNRPRA